MPATVEVLPVLNRDEAALSAAEMAFIKGFARFSFPRVIGTRADAADVENAALALYEFAELCDDMVAAYARYLNQHLTSTINVDDSAFVSPFRDALDDNAVCILKANADRLREDERSDGGRHDFKRSLRG